MVAVALEVAVVAVTKIETNRLSDNDDNVQVKNSAQTNSTTSESSSLTMMLASAGCALLAGLPNQAQASELDNWDFDTATLIYAESDSRVTAAEPVISATRNFDSETKLNLKLAIDSLTGASPSGATPSDQAQTFARPSGRGQYDIKASEQPLDDTFRDGRVAFSAAWSTPINRDWAYSTGGYLSSEHDYQSLGVNGSVSRYLNQKNTTLTFGASFASDSIEPEGGLPVGLSAMAVPGSASFDQDFAKSRQGASDDKTITDFLVGVTQVINRRTLMQFNYSISASDGYLTDPYKIVSVIDDSAGDNYGGNYQSNGQNLYIYEQRPDTRLKQALYWQTKYQRENSDIIDFSYRFMFDDWGINSHTLDLKYRWQLGDHYLEPQLRWYSQSATDFYQRYTTASGYQNVDEISADYRLGDLDTYTLGMHYGYRMQGGSEVYARLAIYQQQSSGNKGFGKLTQQELYPDTTATMLTVGYKF